MLDGDLAGDSPVAASAGGRGAIALLQLLFWIRTAFPPRWKRRKPRYVLVCYPVLLALGRKIFC